MAKPSTTTKPTKKRRDIMIAWEWPMSLEMKRRRRRRMHHKKSTSAQLSNGRSICSLLRYALILRTGSSLINHCIVEYGCDLPDVQLMFNVSPI